MEKLKQIGEKALRWLEGIHLINWLFGSKVNIMISTLGAFVVFLIGWLSHLKTIDLILLTLLTLIFLLLFIHLIIWMVNKPRVQGVIFMGPLIFMSIGVIFLGCGIVWYYYNQSKSIENIAKAPASSQPTIAHHQLEKINQLYSVTKSQSRLYALKENRPKLEKSIRTYNDEAPKNYNRFLEGMDYPYNQNPADFEAILEEINILSKNYFNENLIFNEIDKKYDINMPFKEEENIKDIQNRYSYRKERYEYLSNRSKLENFKHRYEKEILNNEKFIDDYAKTN